MLRNVFGKIDTDLTKLKLITGGKMKFIDAFLQDRSRNCASQVAVVSVRVLEEELGV